MSFENTAILAAVVLLTGVVATIFFYVGLRRSHPDGAIPSLIRYFAIAVLLGFAAYFVGAMAGIFAACNSPKAGNLCGIWGALGTGPLLSGLVLWSYGPWWRRRLVNSSSAGSP
jgi:hypothetical protein